MPRPEAAFLRSATLAVACLGSWAPLAAQPADRAGDRPPDAGKRSDPANAEAQRWLERLRRGDLGERRTAFEHLASLGPAARPALTRALEDPDPDVRFHALLLLHRADGEIARLLRDVAVAPAAPAAEEAYARLLRTPGDLPGLLVGVLRERARPRGGAPGGLRERLLLVGLSAVRDALRARPPRPAAASDLAHALVSLLDFPLGAAFPELVVVLEGLPPEAALAALAARARGPAGRGRARALRALGEVARPDHARQAADVAVALLDDPDPAVRRMAVECLDLLSLPNEALRPVVARARDPKPAVRRAALRVAGERGLGLVREQAERLAADPEQPQPVRALALRALGLVGVGTPALLRRLVESAEPELAALAAWAYGATRGPQAATLLLRRLAAEGAVRRDLLVRGLARLGGHEGVKALAGLLEPDPSGRRRPRGQRLLAVQALGYVRGGRAEATSVLARVAGAPPAARPDAPGPSAAEIEAALLSLAELGARDALAAALLLPRRAGALGAVLDELPRLGLPSDPSLRARLLDVLQGPLRSRTRPELSLQVGYVLASLDPPRARELLRATLRLVGRSDASRELARALARAGDRSALEEHALALSRARLEEAPAELRGDLLNDLGIDLLYAGRLAEAARTFRTMLWCRPSDEVAAYNLACAHALAGEVELALHYLRRSVAFGYRKHAHMRADADLERVRADSRGTRLLRRLRLADELRVEDSEPLGWASE